MGKKKQLFWIIIIILSFAGLQPIQKTKAENSTLTINDNQTNVREGPGLSYQKIGQVHQGDSFSIIKKDGDWIQIELSNNNKGWVASWLVTADEEQKQTKSSSSLTKGAAISINADSLRVRSGPGTGYKVIGTLNNGKTAVITDIDGSWIEIDFSGQNGWVSSEFVKVEKQQSTQEKTKKDGSSKQSDSKKTDPKHEDKIGEVTASTLYVRDGNSQDSEVIGKVYKGDKFPILETSNNWVKIEYKSGSYGWVAGWYIEQSAQAVPSVSKDNTNINSIEILYNGTNIRKKPNVSSEVVQRVNQGTVFETVKLENDWYEIRLQNGSSAYVAGWVVKAQGTARQVVKTGSAANLKNKSIVIDPGHGGRDIGTAGYKGTYEKDVTIQTALLLKNKLNAAGANVIMTRTNDTYLSLSSRVRASHKNDADAFISIHYDSIADRNVKGTTSYYYHSYQKSLASSIHSSLVQYTNLKDRGVRYGDYHILRENKQNAVLLELGYLSNPSEEIIVTSQTFQEQAASGIYQGLASYFKK